MFYEAVTPSSRVLECFFYKGFYNKGTAYYTILAVPGRQPSSIFGSLVQLKITPERVRSVIDLGGCQNYDPFLGPYYSTAPII